MRVTYDLALGCAFVIFQVQGILGIPDTIYFINNWGSQMEAMALTIGLATILDNSWTYAMSADPQKFKRKTKKRILLTTSAILTLFWSGVFIAQPHIGAIVGVGVVAGSGLALYAHNMFKPTFLQIARNAKSYWSEVSTKPKGATWWNSFKIKLGPEQSPAIEFQSTAALSCSSLF